MGNSYGSVLSLATLYDQVEVTGDVEFCFDDNAACADTSSVVSGSSTDSASSVASAASASSAGSAKVIVPAHRCVLAAASPVFKAQFFGPLATTEREVTVHYPTSSDIFGIFVDLIYGTRDEYAGASLTERMEVLLLAHYYQVDYMVEAIKRSLLPVGDGRQPYDLLQWIKARQLETRIDCVREICNAHVEHLVRNFPLSSTEFIGWMTPKRLAKYLAIPSYRQRISLAHVIDWAICRVRHEPTTSQWKTPLAYLTEHRRQPELREPFRDLVRPLLPFYVGAMLEQPVIVDYVLTRQELGEECGRALVRTQHWAHLRKHFAT